MNQSIMDKINHFQYIEFIMTKNDILIKDLTEYMLYQSEKNKMETQIAKDVVEEIVGDVVEVKEEVNDDIKIEFGSIQLKDNVGPFDTIEKISKTEEIAEKKKHNVFNFGKTNEVKAWGDYDSDDDDTCGGYLTAVKKDVEFTEVKHSKNVVTKPVVKRELKVYTKSKYKKNNYKHKKTPEEIEDIIKNRCNINSVSEYVDCLRNSMKPCKFTYSCTKPNCDFAHINPDAECEYTYTGELCPDVRNCKMIHQKRCLHDLDCSNRYCSFKHSSNMPTPEAQQMYIDTMTNYENIVMKTKN